MSPRTRCTNAVDDWSKDFTLHSSYEDAKSGANPWKCPNNAFNYGAVFYGECSPEGNRVRGQYSKWDWYPGPRSDVAYYINKPEDSGVQEVDLASAQSRFVGGTHTDLDIGNVGIEGRTLATMAPSILVPQGMTSGIMQINSVTFLM